MRQPATDETPAGTQAGHMEWTAVDCDACLVTHVMDVIGDRWSVLVLREVMNGVRRFDQIHEHIGVSR